MFTSLSLMKSRDITPEQQKAFDELLEAYCATPDGAWLKNFDYKRYKIKWCDAMNIENGIMGAFIPWAGKAVYLMPNECRVSGFPDPWPEQIVFILVHELRHAWQFKKYGILYILCCLPVLRQLMLEKDAWRITDVAQKFFTEYVNGRCAAKFKRR